MICFSLFLIEGGMKWSKFIQDDNRILKDISPPSRLNTSKSKISSTGNQLALRSIEKAKGDITIRLNKQASTSSIHESELKMNHLVSKFSYRPPKKDFMQDYESSPNFVADAKPKPPDPSDVEQIVERFSRELTEFIRGFLEKIEGMRNPRQLREAIVDRILHSSEDIFTRCIEQLPRLEKSPIRKSMSCIEPNGPVVRGRFQSDKKKARVLLFKNEKVEEKNSFSRIESTVNQMHRILENDKPPKFARTSRVKHGDRSGDSSVEEVMERSLIENRKGYRSRLKSKDAMYTITKILNE